MRSGPRLSNKRIPWLNSKGARWIHSSSRPARTASRQRPRSSRLRRPPRITPEAPQRHTSSTLTGAKAPLADRSFHLPPAIRLVILLVRARIVHPQRDHFPPFRGGASPDGPLASHQVDRPCYGPVGFPLFGLPHDYKGKAHPPKWSPDGRKMAFTLVHERLRRGVLGSSWYRAEGLDDKHSQ